MTPGAGGSKILWRGMKNHYHRLIARLVWFLMIGVMLSGCERQAWQDARKKQSPEGFREYLAKYPEGEHAGIAKQKIEDLAFVKAMKARTPESFRDFLKAFPQGKYVSPAKTNLRELLLQRLENLPVPELLKARVVFETTQGKFILRLRPDQAPRHARNLILLAALEFYDGLPINAAVRGKAVYMGDPRGDRLGGPGYMIPFEPNQLKHVRGAVSMWHLPVDPNTAGSQFFICLSDLPELDGKFTVFAEVEKGMETVDQIVTAMAARSSASPGASPETPPKIQRVYLEGLEVLAPAAPAETKP